MSKRKKTLTQPRKRQASFTRAKLCEMLSTDPRTVTRRAAHLGIKPKRSGKGATAAICYDLTPDQLEQLRRPLPRGHGSGAMDSDLKNQKLQEEVEHLRLKNRKLRDEATPNSLLSELFGGLASFTAGMLKQKLEIENPVQTAGLEADEIREINKKFVDEIIARYDSESAKWAKYRRD